MDAPSASSRLPAPAASVTSLVVVSTFRAASGTPHVGQIAGMVAFRIVQTVLVAGRIEVRPGRRERRHARAYIVDVNPMCTGRLTRELEADAHTVGSLLHSRLAYLAAVIAHEVAGGERARRRRGVARAGAQRQHEQDLQ